MSRLRDKEFPSRVGLTRLPLTLNDMEIGRHFHVTDRLKRMLSSVRDTHVRVGLAIQAGAIRLIGRMLDDFEHVPSRVVDFVCRQLHLPSRRPRPAPARLSRWKQESRLAGALGHRRFDRWIQRKLWSLLRDRAREAVGEDGLLAFAEGFLRHERVLFPPVRSLRRAARKNCDEAIDEALAAVSKRLTKKLKLQVRSLLVTDKRTGTSSLAWLSKPPGDPKEANLVEVGRRLKRLSVVAPDLAGPLGMSGRMKEYLIKRAKSYDATIFRSMSPAMAYPYLALRLADAKERNTDWMTYLHGGIVNKVHRRAKNTILDKTSPLWKKMPQIMAFVHDVADLVLENVKHPEEIGPKILEQIDVALIAKMRDEGKRFITPGGRSAWDYVLRKHRTIKNATAIFLEHVDLVPAQKDTPLVPAIDYFKRHKRRRRPELPADVPTEFVPRSWKDRVIDEKGHVQRRAWELCLADQVTEAIRTGAMTVAGSGHFEALEADLVGKGEWAKNKKKLVAALGIEADADKHLSALQNRIAESARRAAGALKDGDHGVRIEDGRIVVTPLEKEKALPRDEVLAKRIANRIRTRRIENLLLEVDGQSGFLDCFTHLATGRVIPRADREARKALCSAILANGFNHGISTLARSIEGMSRWKIETAGKQYVREETLQAAIARLVEFQRTIPITAAWGEGKTSSSDGQRFRVRGESLFAGYNPRYFAGYKRGITVLTHISDVKTPFYTQIIPVTVREAGYVLDGLLGHGTSLRIELHFVDTAGFTELGMSMCHLLALRLAPRIKDLGRQRLWLPKGVSKKDFGELGDVFAGTIDMDRIREHWDEMLRIAVSLKEGRAKPSVLIRKIASLPRGSALFKAWQDLGRLVKTQYLLDYIADRRFRRRVLVGLNLGEEKHAVSRRFFHGTDGGFRTGDHLAQLYAASCLNLLIGAVAVSNTLEYQRAWTNLGGPARIPVQRLRILSPLSTEGVIYLGMYEFEDAPTAPSGTEGGEGKGRLKKTGS